MQALRPPGSAAVVLYDLRGADRDGGVPIVGMLRNEEAVMKRLSAVALLSLALACGKNPIEPAPTRITALPRTLTTSEQRLIDADNRLAIKLLKQVTTETSDTLPNLFISPTAPSVAGGSGTRTGGSTWSSSCFAVAASPRCSSTSWFYFRRSCPPSQEVSSTGAA